MSVRRTCAPCTGLAAPCRIDGMTSLPVRGRLHAVPTPVAAQSLLQNSSLGDLLHTRTRALGLGLTPYTMRKEAESSKFPIAPLRWLGDRYPHKIVAGYDIGCQFSKTFARSELVQDLKDRVTFSKSPLQPLFVHPLRFEGSSSLLLSLPLSF